MGEQRRRVFGAAGGSIQSGERGAHARVVRKVVQLLREQVLRFARAVDPDQRVGGVGSQVWRRLCRRFREGRDRAVEFVGGFVEAPLIVGDAPLDVRANRAVGVGGLGEIGLS